MATSMKMGLVAECDWLEINPRDTYRTDCVPLTVMFDKVTLVEEDYTEFTKFATAAGWLIEVENGGNEPEEVVICPAHREAFEALGKGNG